MKKRKSLTYVEKINIVIKALRQGPKTWTELKKFGLSEKAVDRVLFALETWKLAEKEDENNRFSRWIWHEHIKKYETKEDYESPWNTQRPSCSGSTPF